MSDKPTESTDKNAGFFGDPDATSRPIPEHQAGLRGREVDTQPNLYNMTTAGETVVMAAEDYEPQQGHQKQKEAPRATLTNMVAEDDEQIYEKAP